MKQKTTRHVIVNLDTGEFLRRVDYESIYFCIINDSRPHKIIADAYGIHYKTVANYKKIKLHAS